MARIQYYHDPAAPAATVVAPCAFAVVRDDGYSVLLVRRVDDGLWELPGGQVQLGESALTAVVRETAEESGVSVQVTGLVGVYTDPSHVIVYPETGEARQQFAVCFHAVPLGGEPRSDGAETCDAAWVRVDELDRLVMHPAMRRRLTDAVSPTDHLQLG